MGEVEVGGDFGTLVGAVALGGEADDEAEEVEVGGDFGTLAGAVALGGRAEDEVDEGEG